MAKKSLKWGTCVICQTENTQINFEHIPPKSCGNSQTRGYENLLKNILTKDKRPTGNPIQGGTGIYSICIECNGKFGKKYVNYYKYVYKQAIDVLKTGDLNHQYDIFPLRFFKQICAMFIALNSQEKFSKQFRDFVLNKDSNDFPNDIKIYLSYYQNKKPIINKLMCRGIFNDDGIKSIYFSEIMFYPFGLVMTLGDNQLSLNMTDITALSKYSYDDKILIELKLSILKESLFNIDDILLPNNK